MTPFTGRRPLRVAEPMERVHDPDHAAVRCDQPVLELLTLAGTRRPADRLHHPLPIGRVDEARPEVRRREPRSGVVNLDNARHASLT